MKEMMKSKRTAALLVLTLAVVFSLSFAAACGGTKNNDDGKDDPAPSVTETAVDISVLSATCEIESYEWGPAVPKVTVKLNGKLSAADVKPDTFAVSFVNAPGFMSTEDTVTVRTVTAAYTSDENGKKVTADSEYVSFELTVKYGEASPFVYTTTNAWDTKMGVKVKINAKTAAGENKYFKANGESSYTFKDADRKVVATAEWQKGTSKTGDITLQTASFAPSGAASDSVKNPLIVWLHGVGGGGTDMDIALLDNEVPALARERTQTYFTTAAQKGAYVFAAQCPTMWMDDGSGQYNTAVSENGGQPSKYTEALYNAITEYVAANPDVDADRIYLGGCSNGGYMTMNMMFEYGDYFAAYYPICEAYLNGNITDAMIARIKDYKIWFVQSENDTTVDPLASAIPTYYRLINAGAQNVRFMLTDKVRATDDPTAAGNPWFGTQDGEYMGHWSWVYAFNDQVNKDFDRARVAADYANLQLAAASSTETVEGPWGPSEVTTHKGTVVSENNYVAAANCTETVEGGLWGWLNSQSK